LLSGFEVDDALKFIGNAFLREALSNPAQQVAQYLGFGYRTGIDEGVVAAIPNIGPHSAFKAKTKIAPLAKTHFLHKL